MPPQRPHSKTKKRKSKGSRLEWWEDWRWLLGGSLGLITLVLGLLFLFSPPVDSPAPDSATSPANSPVTPMSGAAKPRQRQAVEERPIADWILKVGGTLTLADPSGTRIYVSLPEQLPAEGVRIVSVNLCDVKTLTDQDFAQLGKCIALEELLLDRSNVSVAGLYSLEGSDSLIRLSLEDSGMILTGQVMGTPDFMAPEQWLEMHAVDARADLYALGCTYHFLLTGKPPFRQAIQRSMLQLMHAHCREEPPDLTQLLPDIPPAVAGIVARLLRKPPHERFQTAAELAEAIRQVLKGSDPPAGVSSPLVLAEPEVSYSEQLREQQSQAI